MDLRARSIGFAIGLGVVLLVSLPPFVGPGVRGAIMDGFAAVCHQLPGRSPHIDGVSLAVCHRCLGIYLGLPAAALLYGWLNDRIGRRPEWAPGILVASLVPLSIDWLVDVVGIVRNVPLSRGVTGWIFGLVAGYFLVRAIDDLAGSTSARRGPGPDQRSAETARAIP